MAGMAEMSGGFVRDENGALVTDDGPGVWKNGFVRSEGGGLVVTLPPSAVSRDGGSTIAPTEDVPGLVIERPTGGTTDQLVVMADPADDTAHFVTFGMGGNVDTGPLYHWNKNGFGAVGDNGDTNSPPYIAVESGFTLDSIVKLAIAGGTTKNASLFASSKTTKTPGLSLGATGAVRLIAGRNDDGTFRTGDIYAQTDGSFAVTDTAGAGTAGTLLITHTAAQVLVRATAMGGGTPDLRLRASKNVQLHSDDAAAGLVEARSVGFVVWNNAGANKALHVLTGAAPKIGFLGAAPIERPSLPAAATDAASALALANANRAALINLGLAA